MINIRPLEDRVVVKIEQGGEKTLPSGLIIPDVGKDKPQAGEVLAVGPGRYEKGVLIDTGLKIGDKVLFGKYSGTPFKIEEVEVLIMRSIDIMGVVSD